MTWIQSIKIHAFAYLCHSVSNRTYKVPQVFDAVDVGQCAGD
ncbi:hypothetical protein ACF3DV_20670 [Chlorogloeopsis fritschii PCC 9212]|nr:hypothetical protein [Chlorogloeopsis fritschii]